MADTNINDIREILMDDIRSLRNGETTPANVNAVCNAVGKILQTVKMQMEYAKSMGKMPEIPMLAFASHHEEEPANEG